MKFPLICLFVMSCALSGCGREGREALPHFQQTSKVCEYKTELKTEDRLFFGADMQGKQVSAQDFQHFLDKRVTPAFPEGFSVMRAQGQWRYQTGQIQKEPSWMIDLIYTPTDKHEQDIQEIINAYKSLFHQEAVMRSHGTVCARFE